MSHDRSVIGLLTGSTFGSVTDSYTYNSFGEVSNYTAAYPAGLNLQTSYTRDQIGRITTKTEVINGITTTWGYAYDQAGRLIQTTKNGDLWASYGYDSNGNRLTKTTTSQTISGTYDAQDRLLTYGNYTYSYTANGELESKTDTTTGEVTLYEYDVFGNLRKVILPDGMVVEYIVDGRNRRVGKKVNGVIQRQWIYDGQLKPIAEFDGSGTMTAQYVYATHINIPDYIIKGEATYRVITDHLGSLRFVIDTATGTIAQRIDYDDWGNVLLNTAPDFKPFGFAGGIYDSQTKLVRFGARDYDAEVGRWTTKDPIGLSGGLWNIYSYCDSQLVQYFDPRGLWLSGGHNAILNYAFGGILTAGELQTLMDASHYQDTVWNEVQYSYMHAMSAPIYGADKAARMYSSFICGQLGYAEKLERLGHHDLAIWELGKGMHALMDSTSPSHAGFQTWHGIRYRLGFPFLKHVAREMLPPYMFPTSKERAMRELWDYYNRFQKGCPCK